MAKKKPNYKNVKAYYRCAKCHNYIVLYAAFKEALPWYVKCDECQSDRHLLFEAD